MNYTEWLYINAFAQFRLNLLIIEAKHPDSKWIAI